MNKDMRLPLMGYEITPVTKCDHCGKFVANNEEGKSEDFVPDSAFSTEQFVTRCAKCTAKYGKAKCFVF